MTDTKKADTNDRPGTGRLRIYLVMTSLLIGLALAPGYLLLCGYGSGKHLSDHEIACCPPDANSLDVQATTLTLTTDMNPLGLNITMTTPFRDYTAAESGQYHASLSRDGETLWDTAFLLANASRKEAVSGTTFSFRIKTFMVPHDGRYEFAISRPEAMEGIRTMHLEVRRNVAMPNSYVVSLGILILAGVMVWAIFPSKEHDPQADRIGTKWYPD